MLGSGLLDSKVRLGERSPIPDLMQLFYIYNDIYEVAVHSIGHEDKKMYDNLLKIKIPPIKKQKDNELEKQVETLNSLEDFIKNFHGAKNG